MKDLEKIALWLVTLRQKEHIGCLKNFWYWNIRREWNREALFRFFFFNSNGLEMIKIISKLYYLGSHTPFVDALSNKWYELRLNKNAILKEWLNFKLVQSLIKVQSLTLTFSALMEFQPIKFLIWVGGRFHI